MTSIFDTISDMPFDEAAKYILLLPLQVKQEYFEIGVIAYVILGLIALLLSATSIIILATTKKRKMKSNFVTQTQANQTVKHVNFGIIIDDTHVESSAKRYKYFIIKDKTEQVDKLPIGAVVIILKQSKTEAHVREATADEIKTLKKQGLIK